MDLDGYHAGIGRSDWHVGVGQPLPRRHLIGEHQWESSGSLITLERQREQSDSTESFDRASKQLRIEQEERRAQTLEEAIDKEMLKYAYTR